MRNFIIKCGGFVVGAGVVLVIEITLLMLLNALFDARLMPRGAGWAVLPIVAGIGMAKISPELITDLPRLKECLSNTIHSLSKPARIVLTFPLLWVFIVGTYVILFNPYGYMTSYDYSHMMKVMFFPPFIVGIMYFVYKKFIDDSPNK